MFRHRWLIALAATAVAFLLVTADAHARRSPATPRPSVRPDSVLACSAADCSAGSLPVSSVRVCLACYSGTDFSVAWRASPRSSVCYYRSCWS